MANEMAQWLGALLVTLDDLSLTPRTHVIEEENQLPHIVLWPPQRYGGIYTPKKLTSTVNTLIFEASCHSIPT